MKRFNTTGTCFPNKHYMVDLTERCGEIKKMVDNGDYFCINHGRQYGKTTTLNALKKYLSPEYAVFSISFESIESEFFSTDTKLGQKFISILHEKAVDGLVTNLSAKTIDFFHKTVEDGNSGQVELKSKIKEICRRNEKPIVIIIDEVDQASNYESFLKFLGILRAMYLDREENPTFQSVILAGVYNIKNLKLKIRTEGDHQYNSPWNIASDFKINMALTASGIAGMLQDYETEHHTGMNINETAQMLAEDTNGYPFLVSRLCKIMDEDLITTGKFASLSECWTKRGFLTAENMLLKEENSLWSDLSKKISDFPDLALLLRRILFNGESIALNRSDRAQNLALMFDYLKDNGNYIVVSNRIFETYLYDAFLYQDNMQKREYSSPVSQNDNIFVQNGRLNMDFLLEQFIKHYNEIFPSEKKHPKWVEEDARKCFLMYLRPIINGSGHYYIEARTRNNRQMDVVVNYNNEEFIIELKIWRGQIYNDNGIEQLCNYLESMHANKGYLVSFNFNQKKETGLKTTQYGDKTIVEADL